MLGRRHARVDLDRDLGAGRGPERLEEVRRERVGLLRRQVGRRPAPPVDLDDGARPVDAGGEEVDLAVEVGEVPLDLAPLLALPVGLRDDLHEAAAEPALLVAEREVDVEGDRAAPPRSRARRRPRSRRGRSRRSTPARWGRRCSGAPGRCTCRGAPSSSAASRRAGGSGWPARRGDYTDGLPGAGRPPRRPVGRRPRMLVRRLWRRERCRAMTGREPPALLLGESPEAGCSTRPMPSRARVLALCDPEIARERRSSPSSGRATGELEGCEALLRLPPGSGFAGPYEAFTEALRLGLAAELEVASTARVLRDAEPFAGDHLIFLNVLAPFLDRPAARTPPGSWSGSWRTDGSRPASSSSCPEISRIADFQAFARALEPYRLEGFRVAIDDFGAGYTNLRMITDIAPDFVKLDRVFIENIFVHARKRILVESVVSLCHRINCGVVAEGIETRRGPRDLPRGRGRLPPGLPPGASRAARGGVPRGGPDRELGARRPRARGDRRRRLPGADASRRRAALGGQRLLPLRPDLDVVPILLSGRAIGLLGRARATAFPFLSGTSEIRRRLRRGRGHSLGSGRRGDAARAGRGAHREAAAGQPLRADRRDGTGEGLSRAAPVRRPPRALRPPPRRERPRVHPLTNLPGRGRLEAEPSGGSPDGCPSGWRG